MPDQPRHLERLHSLISRQADGLITPEEHGELAAALEADPESRKQWFLRSDIEIAVRARSAAHGEGMVLPDSTAARDGRPLRRLQAAALAGPLLTALGVAIGVFGASAVWAFALPRPAFTETVIRVLTEGFEDGVAATEPGLPGGAGDAAGDVWRGDEARVVTAGHQVTPAHGGRMLAFQRSTHAGEDPPASAWSDVYRFVDARPFLAQAMGQPVTARLTASFAASPDACGEGEAYSGSVHVCALDRDLSAAPMPVSLAWVRDHCVASGMKRIPLACGRTAWQQVSVDASLPPDAKFVLLHIAAVRDRPEPSSKPAVFRGHFVDDVSLEFHVRKPVR